MNRFVCIGLAVLLTGCAVPLNKPGNEVVTTTVQSNAIQEVDRTSSEQTASDNEDAPLAVEETLAQPTEGFEPTPEPTAEPTPEPTPEPTAEPTPEPEPIEGVESPYHQNYGDPGSEGSLSNKMLGWYFTKNSNHQPTVGPREIDIRPYGGYYLGDIDHKEFYLTMDHGYENGYTPVILDVLKEKDVTAAFFVTQTYIRDNQEIVKRMVEEGHIVGNHSVTHPSFPDLTDEQIAQEINETARYFQEITGQEMPKFFRPPSGEYSARVLARTNELGYKTIFWSFAYRDWLVDDQPGKDYAYNIVMDNLHPGEIILLHAVSSSNTEALGDMIDGIRAQGYTFKSLYDLP